MPQNDSKITFSRSAIEAIPLPLGSKRAYFRDAKESGLRLMLTPLGARSFQLYLKHDGRPVNILLGRFSPQLAESAELPRDCSHTEFLLNNPDLNVRQARHLAALVKLDLKAGINPTELKKVKRGELTLGQLFEVYFERHLVAKKKKRANDIRGEFERLLGAMPKAERKKHGRERQKTPGSVNWQNRRLSSISRADVKTMSESLARESSNYNANRAITILRSMFNRAKDFELFKGDNPAESVELYDVNSRERFLQADEMPRFFCSLMMEPSAEIRDYLLISLLTGARKANVLEMAWADINLDRATWVVPGELSKNGEPITLPLPPEVVVILRARKPKEAAQFVFPGGGKSGHLINPRKGWLRVLDRDELLQLADRITASGGTFEVNITDQDAAHFDFLAVALKNARKLAAEMKIDLVGTRLEDLRPHDLRRTMGSWQAAGGASILLIMKSLGQKSEAAAKIYAQLCLDPVRNVVESAAKSILKAGGMVQEPPTKPADEVKTSPRKGKRAKA